MLLYLAPVCLFFIGQERLVGVSFPDGNGTDGGQHGLNVRHRGLGLNHVDHVTIHVEADVTRRPIAARL
jgi:hypothetical protein